MYGLVLELSFDLGVLSMFLYIWTKGTNPHKYILLDMEVLHTSLVFSSNFLSMYQYFQIKSAEFVMNYFQLTFFFWHFWKKIS